MTQSGQVGHQNRTASGDIQLMLFYIQCRQSFQSTIIIILFIQLTINSVLCNYHVPNDMDAD